MQVKYLTETGQQLDPKDVEDINKRTRQETAKNLFAAIGVVSTAVVVYRLAKHKNLNEIIPK